MAENEVPETATEKLDNSSTATGGSFIPGTEDLELLPLKDYFDISGNDDYTGWKDDLRFIVDWAKDEGIKNKEDMLMALKNVEKDLGSSIHNNRLTKVRNYLSLMKKYKAIRKEMRSLEE